MQGVASPTLVLPCTLFTRDPTSLLEQMEAGAMGKGSYGESMHTLSVHDFLPSPLVEHPTYATITDHSTIHLSLLRLQMAMLRVSPLWGKQSVAVS